MGKILHDFDGGASDLCNNSEGVDSSRQRQVQMMDRELEASNVFENTNEYSKQTGEFLIREFIKKGKVVGAWCTEHSLTEIGSLTLGTWLTKRCITTFT